MKYSDQIKELCNTITNETNLEDYSIQDLIHSLLIFKAVLTPLAINKFQEDGVNDKNALIIMNTFGAELKTIIEDLIGQELNFKEENE